jgi:2-oxoglutarate ferredoxin oxidoreductase subunit gamma
MRHNTQQEIIVSGFGGQGVLFLGKFIASVAMEEGYHVTYIPSYGAEVRGGTANCTVIYSPEEIASPVTASPTAVFAMNMPSVVRFCPRLRKNGLLMYNSTLVKEKPERADILIVPVPANDLAEKAGDKRTANVVMLGAYISVWGLTTIEKAVRMLKDGLKGKEALIDINIRALSEGHDFAESLG